MPTHTFSALLTDETGMILLARRKNSSLWSLPGGDARNAVSPISFLAICCQRQVGVSPDLVAPFFTFTFAGRTVSVGTDEIPHERARACGRMEASGWFERDKLPMNLDPLSRMAISLRISQPAPAHAPAAMHLATAC